MNKEKLRQVLYDIITELHLINGFIVDDKRYKELNMAVNRAIDGVSE